MITGRLDTESGVSFYAARYFAVTATKFAAKSNPDRNIALSLGSALGMLHPMATVYETLRADIVAAMKARDSALALALRTMDAAIQRAAMDASKPIDDPLTVATIRKAVKNLTDARAEFERGGRADLATANTTEIGFLGKYLPAGLDAAKLGALIAEAIATTGAASKKEMGKVIGALKQHPDAPLIDFGAASKMIQSKLP